MPTRCTSRETRRGIERVALPPCACFIHVYTQPIQYRHIYTSYKHRVDNYRSYTIYIPYIRIYILRRAPVIRLVKFGEEAREWLTPPMCVLYMHIHNPYRHIDIYRYHICMIMYHISYTYVFHKYINKYIHIYIDICKHYMSMFISHISYHIHCIMYTNTYLKVRTRHTARLEEKSRERLTPHVRVLYINIHNLYRNIDIYKHHMHIIWTIIYHIPYISYTHIHTFTAGAHPLYVS